MTKDPVEGYDLGQIPKLMQAAGVLVQSAGQVPWDADDITAIVEDQLSSRPVMTPAEIVSDADLLYGEGWGVVLLRVVEAGVAQRR